MNSVLADSGESFLQVTPQGMTLVSAEDATDAQRVAEFLQDKFVCIMVRGSDGCFYHWNPGKKEYP